MNETQPPLLSPEQRQRLELRARQQQAQQRQILAMMGIGQWVRPDSLTAKISDITDVANMGDSDISQMMPTIASSAKPHDSQDNSLVANPSTTAPVAMDQTDIIDDDTNFANTIDSSIDKDSSIDNHTASATVSNKSYNFDDLNSFVESELTEEAGSANDAGDSTSLAPRDLDPISLVKVAPFDLQGGRYGNWVLIVDIQALNNDTQKLWQNITQALSLQCETSSFPICEGMDTAELANASLAGYIFKIGQSEDIKIAVLTALPEGLTHPNFTEVPSLEAMLADSNLKRQLWQQLSGQ